MNYTNPDDLNHEDSPQDWLNSSLIFARTLSLILNDSEGIVVNLSGDMHFPDDPTIKKVIVFNKDEQIHVVDCEGDIEEGTYVKIFEHGLN